MNSITKTALCAAIAAMFGLGSAALAGPPGHAGGPPERAGPPFGNGDFNPGPPENANNGGDEEAEQEQENGDANDDSENGSGGPPGLCGTEGDGPEGRAGQSHIAHLNFSQRDPDTGEPLEDGSWGRMRYVWSGPQFDYVFNGHELPAGIEYEMTYQPEPTPSPGVVCLGTGIVNDEGDLHIANSVELNGDLPMPDDESEDGALLAVVLKEDVDCSTGEMLTFLPGDYLFGNALIEYVDTDFEEEEDGS